MKSVTTRSFREQFARLPQHIQDQVREAYKLFLQDPFHNSLHFKRVNQIEPVYSARVTLDYRAVCLLENGTANWFWVGKHSEYDKFLKTL